MTNTEDTIHASDFSDTHKGLEWYMFDWKKITSSISLPTIGIGSSKYCDGQVLVFDDLIKIDKKQYFPKFVKNYLNFDDLASDAVKKFCTDVRQKKFPSKKYSYQY